MRFSNTKTPCVAKFLSACILFLSLPVLSHSQPVPSALSQDEETSLSLSQPAFDLEFVSPPEIVSIESEPSGPLQKLCELPVAPTRGEHIVETALPFLGSAYRFGGTSPKTGFDCSGMVQYVYAKWGVKLPRTAELQFRKGKPVDFYDLQPGDLIFLSNTYKHGISHVGIYIGRGQWVQAASRRQGVIVSNIPLFTGKHSSGARRYDLSSLPPVPGETPDYLNSLAMLHTELAPKVERIAIAAPIRTDFSRSRTLAYRGGTARAKICGDSGELAHSGCTSFKIVQTSITRLRKLKRCRLHKLPTGEAG